MEKKRKDLVKKKRKKRKVKEKRNRQIKEKRERIGNMKECKEELKYG